MKPKIEEVEEFEKEFELPQLLGYSIEQEEKASIARFNMFNFIAQDIQTFIERRFRTQDFGSEVFHVYMNDAYRKTATPWLRDPEIIKKEFQDFLYSYSGYWTPRREKK